MNQSRRLLKFLGSFHRVRSFRPHQLRHQGTSSELSPPFSQPHRFAGTGSWQLVSQCQFASHASQVSKFSSMASPEITVKDGNLSSSAENAAATSNEIPEVNNESAGQGADQTKSEDVQNEDLLGLLGERDVLLEEKEKLIAEMQIKVLRSLAEVENVRDRARREAENTKKYAIQNFAKSLLDVADNLGRAAATVPESIHNEALANDPTNNAKLLKSLLEGVEMTEKQLTQIFKKFGLQKFDPVGQQFDPNQHLALFEVQDSSKNPETVATVVKSGYMLHDRVIRPAEVGVVKAE